MKKAVIVALVALAAAAVATAALARPAAGTAPDSLAASACTSASIGFAGPLTGPAAFLGQEQLSWSRFAAQQYNRQFNTAYKIVQGDTQLSAALSRTVGRQFVSNKSIWGVIGPSTSQAVISSAGLFKVAKLAAVSGSATRTDLTTGGKFPTFFRVVPNDFVQSPSIVNFAVKTLKAKHVVVIDSQDDYSTALAKGTTYRFRLKGVKVDRESVAATDTDFSSIVTNVAGDVQVVVFATQAAGAAQQLSNQLREQGKKAVVFGTDGAYSPSQFKPKNGYVSSFAPDIRLVRGGASVVRGYKAFSHGKSFGTFGPPSYMATWVLMGAISAACQDGSATRAEVTANVRKTNVPSILGGQVRFTKKGDVAGAKFYVFKITNGTYALAG
jgi:branched-chain amino acid transport system substrate-binding protein